MLIMKLLLVSSILMLAVRHKYKLVPNLKRALGSSKLNKSISIEMLIAFLILLITAGLTSIVGPDY